MNHDVGPNFICRPYRGLSVQDVAISLDESSVRSFLLGRPVYRRTEFMVLVRDGQRAVVQVAKKSTDPLFAPVTEVRYLAGPEMVTFVEDDSVDTGNASDLARCALNSGVEAYAYVIQGSFQHVNIIVAPDPLRIRVVEVIPPEPPKLLEMARKVLSFDEDLPPVLLDFVAIDLRKLAREANADHYLFPCRCSGLELDAEVDFLDACPETLREWTLVGCERSAQIHDFFYGQEPAGRVDMCPKVVDTETGTPTLTKCCLLERGIESAGSRLVVPWGASLEEVRQALHELVALKLAPVQ